MDQFQWPEVKWSFKAISKEFKLAVISGLIIGIITHLYVFNNLLLMNDAVLGTYTNNEHLASGRWSLAFMSSFSSDFQLPVVIGLLSIVMIALTCGLTVKILELSHPGSIILTAALLVTFPTVGCTFAYMFTADAYFIVLFMNALAVYLTKKYRFGCVPAIILLAVACGSYQAYFCYAIGLFVFDCILALLSSEKFSAVLARGGKYILTLLMGLFLYIIVQDVSMKNRGVALTSYQGMDTIGKLDIKERLTAVPNTYKIFGEYFMNWPYILPVFRIAQWLAILLLAAFLLYLVVKKHIYRDIPRLLLVILGCILIPLSLNFIAVLAYRANVHRLMIYAYILLFVFVIKCAELMAQQMILQVGGGGNRYWLLPLGISFVCLWMVVWNNFCITNIGYHNFQLRYENSFALANRIVARIEELDGYSVGSPIAIIGRTDADNYGNGQRYQDYRYAIMNSSYLSIIPAFLEYYIGEHVLNLTGEQREAIENNDEVINMPHYPAEGSIAMVDGIVVVKLGEGTVTTY